MSPSNFVQCDVRQSDAYKNWTDGLAKSVGQQKSDRFWLFDVNDPLLGFTQVRSFYLYRCEASLPGVCYCAKLGRFATKQVVFRER